MPITVDVRKAMESSRELRKALKKATEGEIKRATVTAINQTARQTRTEANRELRKHLNVKAKSVNTRIRIKRANKNTMQATLTFRADPPFSISSFKPVQRKYGVGARIYKGGGIVRFPGYFGPEIGKLKGGVYHRQRKTPYPIEIRPAISMVAELHKHGIVEKVAETVPEKFAKNFRGRLEYMALRKKTRKKKR